MLKKRIVCCGDIHIFKNKRHKEHEYLFKVFFQYLIDNKIELVVITGDIIDSKINISPEQVHLLRYFLTSVANICPVIQILGNHDLNLKNTERLDLVSEIIESVTKTKHEITFYKHSGQYNKYDINWAVWSCLDDQLSPFKDNDVKSTDYTIGLFHGAVAGCIADNGFKLTEGIDISEFDNCDLVLMSDIHLGESFRNGEVCYTGSFLQTKLSEKDYGTFLRLDLKKNKYEIKQERLDNPFSTLVLEYNSDEYNEHLKFLDKFPETKRLEIQYDKKLYLKSELINVKKTLKNEFKGIVEVKPKIISKDKKKDIEVVDQKTKDYKEYIRKFLNYHIDKLNITNIEEDLENVLLFDNDYESAIDVVKEFEEGDFYIESMKIFNLYSFPPEETYIPISETGLTGIDGENTVGKSTLGYKIFQFLVFNSIPDNTNSLRSIINKNNRDTEAWGEIILNKQGTRYKIHRVLTPNKKGKVTQKLTFGVINDDGEIIEALHDESRTATEPIIQRYFGTEDSFNLLNLFSALKKQVEFIDCKNTERLKKVNQFLGLQRFEIKEKLVSEDLKVENKTLNTKLEEFDSLESKEELENNQNELVVELNTFKKKKKGFEDELEKVTENYEKVKEKKIQITSKLNDYKYETESSLEEQITDIEKLSLNVDKNIKSILETNELIVENKSTIQIEINEQTKELAELQDELESIEKVHSKKIKSKEKEVDTHKQALEDFINKELEEYNNNKTLEFKRIVEIDNQRAINNSDITRFEKQLKIDLCNNCGKEFNESDKKKVKLQIKDLESANLVLQQEEEGLNKILESKLEEVVKYKEQKISLQNIVTSANTQFEKFKRDLNDEKSVLTNKIEKLELLISSNEKELKNKDLSIESNLNKIDRIKLEVENSKLKIKELKDAIENIKILNIVNDDLKTHKQNVDGVQLDLNSVKEEIVKTETRINTINTKLEVLKIKQEELSKQEKIVRLLKIYKKVVSKDGLPLFILKENISEINTEINTIGNQIFDFDIIFEVDEENGDLNIEFKYDNEEEETTDVSLASGSETFIINLCIKVGLTQLSKLPKLQCLIVDEGFGTLDKTNIEKIPMLFENLLNYYRSIIMISHLDELKDSYQHKIHLIKENSYTIIQ